ncbi:YveK family protein [Neobacillus niacini]|uniref:YveK family protein n=1 Tax=Neobacillus niacini TaxID=86668 RepID=UPI00203B19A1|nr:Wzz/FepE/Etk N-terminal domain-containing protein [Neobacillus niacini]MCM3693187.1 Wzz/FepE/Etk N-terminal domain-containing protein [Neobacillus niacini]
MEETISLKELLQTLRKRIGLILSITFLAGTVSGLISYFYLTPIYQSSTKLLINQTKDEQSSLNSMDIQVQANLQLIDTYNEIIKSSRILSMVSQKVSSELTVGQLNEQISIQKSENSQVVTIVVKNPDAELAAEIADTTAEVFQTEIVKIMKVDNVNILDAATVNNSPVAPNPLMNIAIAIVVGLMAGVGLAFLLDYFDSTLKSENDIERILELPILGNIAVIDDAKMEELSRRKSTRMSVGRGEIHGS